MYGIIYKVTNIVNNKNYIGQTRQKNGFDSRYGGSGIQSFYNYYKRSKYKNGQYIAKEIAEYGFNNFIINKTLDVAYSKESLDKLEEYYIQKYDCLNNGYNSSDRKGVRYKPTKRYIIEFKKEYEPTILEYINNNKNLKLITYEQFKSKYITTN